MRWERSYVNWLRAAWGLAVAVYAAGLVALIVDGEWEVAAAAGAGIAVLLFVGWHWRASSRASSQAAETDQPDTDRHRSPRYGIARGSFAGPSRFRTGPPRRSLHRLTPSDSRRVVITELQRRRPTNPS